MSVVAVGCRQRKTKQGLQIFFDAMMAAAASSRRISRNSPVGLTQFGGQWIEQVRVSCFFVVWVGVVWFFVVWRGVGLRGLLGVCVGWVCLGRSVFVSLCGCGVWCCGCCGFVFLLRVGFFGLFVFPFLFCFFLVCFFFFFFFFFFFLFFRFCFFLGPRLIGVSLTERASVAQSAPIR